MDHGSQESKKVPLVYLISGRLLGSLQLPWVVIFSHHNEFIVITSACLPKVKCPTSWHLKHSPNHWANEFTTKDYIQKINPYLMKKREELCLASIHHALCIFDNFKGQLTDKVLQLLGDISDT